MAERLNQLEERLSNQLLLDREAIVRSISQEFIARAINEETPRPAPTNYLPPIVFLASEDDDAPCASCGKVFPSWRSAIHTSACARLSQRPSPRVKAAQTQVDQIRARAHQRLESLGMAGGVSRPKPSNSGMAPQTRPTPSSNPQRAPPGRDSSPLDEPPSRQGSKQGAPSQPANAKQRPDPLDEWWDEEPPEAQPHPQRAGPKRAAPQRVPSRSDLARERGSGAAADDQSFGRTGAPQEFDDEIIVGGSSNGFGGGGGGGGEGEDQVVGFGSGGGPDAEFAEVQDLVPCDNCGRNFLADRLEKHMKICLKQKQRKTFGPDADRVKLREQARWKHCEVK